MPSAQSVVAPFTFANTKSSVRNAPEGSWVCECGNVNYPSRLKCNAHNCDKEKPVDFTPGPVAMPTMQTGVFRDGGTCLKAVF